MVNERRSRVNGISGKRSSSDLSPLKPLLVVLALSVGELGRVLFRRPWTVEGRVTGTKHGGEWKVVGWQANGELVNPVGERLRSTGPA